MMVVCMCKNRKKPLITVYTPTYNRAQCLVKLHESLCLQSCKDFEWYIIDDGSTDNTSELVKEWISSSSFVIRYFYKQNEGVHTARDFAYDLIDSELIVGVDSDDSLLPNAIEIISKKWLECDDRSKLCGIVTYVQDNQGIFLGKKLPQNDFVTYQDLIYKYQCRGDYTFILRSNVIKKIPKAPIFEGEKLVSESYKWIQLPELPFLVFRSSTIVHNYLESGYTLNVRKNWFRNLNGYSALYNQHLKNNRFLKYRILFAVKYVIASLFLQKKQIVKESNAPFLTMLFFPFAWIVYYYMRLKYRNLYRD